MGALLRCLWIPLAYLVVSECFDPYPALSLLLRFSCIHPFRREGWPGSSPQMALWLQRMCKERQDEGAFAMERGRTSKPTGAKLSSGATEEPLVIPNAWLPTS